MDEVRIKQQLIEKIAEVFETENEYRQILRIIQENNVKFTENKQGCFINLEDVPMEIIEKLMEIVNLCEESKKYHQKMNDAILDLKKDN